MYITGLREGIKMNLITFLLAAHNESYSQTQKKIICMMKFALSLSLFAALGTADQWVPIKDGEPFTIQSATRGSEENMKWNAMNRHLFANATNQEANCEGGKQDFAAFVIEGDELFLYSKAGEGKRQQVYASLLNNST